ncbi:MAG: hypothetical protein J6N21_11430 [Butyrivibrio sp.]|nr:hypothetical protein [Butyrivibrio sp.]
MNLNDKKDNNSNRFSYGVPQTGNMKSYSGYGIKHDQRQDGLNHQTHPDRLQHRQTNKFGK